MNYKQANLEICRAIIKGELIRVQKVNENLYCVIPGSGYYGYLFPKNEIAFSLEKGKVQFIADHSEENNIAHLELANEDNIITSTDYMMLLSYSKYPARKFVNHGKEVWINTGYMKLLDPYCTKFYQSRENPLSTILATECGQPVMCILPIRVVK